MSNSSATPWTVAHPTPLSMGFPKQIYWSGLPFSSPGHLSHPRIERVSLALAGGFSSTAPAGKSCLNDLNLLSLQNRTTNTSEHHVGVLRVLELPCSSRGAQGFIGLGSRWVLTTLLFTEHLLHPRYSSWHWGSLSEQGRKKPCSRVAHLLSERDRC